MLIFCLVYRNNTQTHLSLNSFSNKLQRTRCGYFNWHNWNRSIFSSTYRGRCSASLPVPANNIALYPSTQTASTTPRREVLNLGRALLVKLSIGKVEGKKIYPTVSPNWLLSSPGERVCYSWGRGLLSAWAPRVFSQQACVSSYSSQILLPALFYISPIAVFRVPFVLFQWGENESLREARLPTVQ